MNHLGPGRGTGRTEGREQRQQVLVAGLGLAGVGVLDFSRPDPADSRAERISQFQRGYLRRVVVPVAAAAGLEEQYAYLEESLRRFPTGPEQEQLALEAGFAAARHWPVALGLMGRLDLVA